MSLFVAFSANATLFDRGIRLTEQQLEHDHAPEMLATHAWIERRYWQATVQHYEGIEAVKEGVRLFAPIGGKRGQVVRRYLLHVTSAQEEAAWAYARGAVGDPYDWGGVALAFVYLLTGRCERFEQSKRANFFCSMLVTDALRAAGVDLLPGVDDTNVTPARLEAAAVTVGSATP